MRYYVFPCNAVHAPEHLTVNQGVTGSSPVGGVHKKPAFIRLRAFLILYITGNIPLEGLCALFGNSGAAAIAVTPSVEQRFKPLHPVFTDVIKQEQISRNLWTPYYKEYTRYFTTLLERNFAVIRIKVAEIAGEKLLKCQKITKGLTNSNLCAIIILIKYL